MKTIGELLDILLEKYGNVAGDGYMHPITDLDKLDGIHVIPTVWSNGRAVRRYCGQDGDANGQSSNKSSQRTKSDGYRKMVAILIEFDERDKEL